ncbi:MAG TPA: VOC family protein [Candidatus Acidoferrales bacterium]|nr:VOC family protein [Candidatus Acidoferrales bacterium]
MTWLRGIMLFLAGTAFGLFLMQPAAAPQDKTVGLRLNHFGLYVKDLDESRNFYTKTMGFREAFEVKDKEGKPALVYLQMDRDTFLELAPANVDRPIGFSHAGLWTNDLNKTVTILRERGVKMENPISGGSKALLTNMIEPNGVRLELLEYPPDSLQRKAIDGWK